MQPDNQTAREGDLTAGRATGGACASPDAPARCGRRRGPGRTRQSPHPGRHPSTRPRRALPRPRMRTGTGMGMAPERRHARCCAGSAYRPAEMRVSRWGGLFWLLGQLDHDKKMASSRELSALGGVPKQDELWCPGCRRKIQSSKSAKAANRTKYCSAGRCCITCEPSMFQW